MCGSRKHHERSGGMAVARRSDLRASDAEREGTISDLRAHAAEGRLTVEELEERIDGAYAARTGRELVALTADLPRPRRSAQAAHRARAEHVRSYVGVMLLLVVIWAATGMGYFWPLWPALGWGIAVLPDAMRLPRRTARS